MSARVVVLVAVIEALGGCAARRGYLQERQRGMREAVVTLVPATARARVGLSDAELARETFVEGPALEAIHAAVEPQMPSAADCVVPPASAWASFVVNGGGAPLDVRAAGVGPRELRLACVEDAVRRWTFPKDPGARGRVVVQVYGAAPPGEARAVVTDEEGRVLDPRAIRRAAPRDPGCVAKAVRQRGAVAEATAGSVVARFAVTKEGEVRDVHFLTPTLVPVANAVKSAIEGCEWTPGARDGDPVSLWMVLPLRFE